VHRPTAPRLTAFATRFLLLFAAHAAVSGCSAARPSSERSPQVAEGAQLYRTYCGLCHGDQGEGYAADHANALANPDFLATASDEFLRVAVERGRPGTAMAAYSQRFGGPLASNEVDALLAFLRSKQRGAAIDVSSFHADAHGLDVRPIYERECAACHGERGQGATAPSLNNETFASSASDGFLRHAIAHGRDGTPMPAFEPRLSANEIDALVAYVRTFGRREVERRPSPIPADLPVVIHPDGPAPQFTLREGRFVSSAQVAAALAAGKRLVIVDARAPSDWALLRIPGAIPVPYYAIDDLVARLPNDDTFIVAYCACPHAASGHVVDALRERGYANTAVLDEGILVWRELGHPVEGESVGE